MFTENVTVTIAGDSRHEMITKSEHVIENFRVGCERYRHCEYVKIIPQEVSFRV